MAEESTPLTDQDLILGLHSCARNDRESLVSGLRLLGEFDRRRLYCREGYPSAFSYLAKALGYAEAEAYCRVYAARAARRFPEALEMLAKGETHPASMSLLSGYLNAENHGELLEKARGKSRREVEEIVAGLDPRPDVPDSVRRETVSPLAPQRVHFGFTAGLEILRMIKRARELLRHKRPAGSLAEVFSEVLDFFLDRRDPERRLEKGTCDVPPGSRPEPAPGPKRGVPARVQKEVWRRDAGRCAFVPDSGKRCEETLHLEFDHVIPWAMGGRSDDASNIRLLCRAHNRMFGREVFG